MKFWELISITRGEGRKIRAAASREAEWRFVIAWMDDLDNIIASHDRAKLDCPLPNGLVREALRRCRVRFYLSRDNILRARRYSIWEKGLSALQAFDRFGGHAMEEALEFGSVSVAGMQTSTPR